MASSAASSKRKRQYACGSIDDCGDPLDDNAMSLVVRWPTHTTDPTLCVALHTHKTHFFLRFFLSLGRVKVVTTRDERESFFLFFFCVLCFVFCVFLCATFSLFFVCVFLIPKDIQAELLSEYPEYLRDSRVLIASLLSIVPLTHLLIFHLFSGGALLLRCELGLSQILFLHFFWLCFWFLFQNVKSVVF
jgi:hypothetical protein